MAARAAGKNLRTRVSAPQEPARGAVRSSVLASMAMESSAPNSSTSVQGDPLHRLLASSGGRRGPLEVPVDDALGGRVNHCGPRSLKPCATHTSIPTHFALKMAAGLEGINLNIGRPPFES